MAEREEQRAAATTPRLGRRRRRLYWTVAILVVAAVAGVAFGVSIYRANRPETYRPGERHAEITSRLELGLPDDAPEPVLTDVTAGAGLGAFRAFAGNRTSQLPEDMGPGAAWGDYDGDGDDDLFLVSQGGPLGSEPHARAPSMLYRNNGDGTFRRVDGFPDTRILGMGAAWGDYDGDGRLDLVVTGFDVLRLFRNEGERFVSVPALAERPGFWAGASWSDFDLDGDLDLYVCGYVRYDAEPGAQARTTQQYGRAVPYTLNPASFRPERNLLFRNDGRGRFEEVAADLGVDNPQGRSLGALWWDLDDDGWPELYVANDISDNALYRNLRGSFEDISHAAWVADYRGAMGLAAGDWNRDGDDDLFVSHWIAQENALYDSLLANLEREAGSPVPALRFMDVADQRGLGQIALQLIGWGAEFADLDADGWLDLVVANGSTFETADTPRELRAQPSFLFWNRRGESFHDLAPLTESLSMPRVSRGLALSDYDNDGDLDLLFVDRDAGVRLLRNDMQSGRWVELRLRRARPASPVEGTVVVAAVGDAVMRRTVSSVSYLSQSTRTVHLGLGEADRVDRLEVRWPGGAVDALEGLEAGAIWEVVEGQPAPRRVKTVASGTSTAATAPSAGGGPMSERERVTEFWRAQRAAMNAMKVANEPERAIPLFRRALELDPVHEDSLYYLGNCLAETGDTEGALERFAELMRINPMSHRAHKRWGALRAAHASGADDYAAAIVALERAREINPEETGVLLVLGEIALIRGERELARERLHSVTRSNPQSVEAFFLLAAVARLDGNDAGAREMLGRAKAARGEEWRPEGTAAEGDVRRKMHREPGPLVRFVEGWDGSTDPARALSALETHLRKLARSD